MNGDEFERRVKQLDMPAPRVMARLGISRMTFYRWRRDGVPADRAQLVDLALRYLALEQSALREVRQDA
jgi:predicted DNA-binding transcriptional regulator AlpA